MPVPGIDAVVRVPLREFTDTRAPRVPAERPTDLVDTDIRTPGATLNDRRILNAIDATVAPKPGPVTATVSGPPLGGGRRTPYLCRHRAAVE